MPTVPLEMSEIIEESTIVRDALDERRLTSRRNRPPLLRSDGVFLPDRERASTATRRNVPVRLGNVSSSALRSEAINQDVGESLSNFRSQHSRQSVTRPDVTRLEGMMAQMQEMERVLLTDESGPNPLMISRLDRFSENAPHVRHLPDITRHLSLGLVRRNVNASVEITTRSDFSYFDQFVSSEFPLPSYKEALSLPAIPKYSMNDEFKNSKEKDLSSVYRTVYLCFYLKHK